MLIRTEKVQSPERKTSVLHGRNPAKRICRASSSCSFTTNCHDAETKLHGPGIYYRNCHFPGTVHINEEKDFTPVIQRALELGGYQEDQHFTGINGGTSVTTGFFPWNHSGVADQVIDAVKAGAIRHFFLVAGCDGARSGRNYYTDFVKQSPSDSVILTLACGKYRFNDLTFGTIGGLQD